MNKWMRVFWMVFCLVILSTVVTYGQEEEFTVDSFRPPFARSHSLSRGTGSPHFPPHSLDIRAIKPGTWDDAVYAMAKGTVIESMWDGTEEEPGYGNYILIDHGGGWYSRYAHLSGLSTQHYEYKEDGLYHVWKEQTDVTRVVSKGDSVVAGQLIGFMGSTGNSDGSHLHLEYYQSDDPYKIATMKKVWWWDQSYGIIKGQNVDDPACNDKSYTGVDFLREKYCQKGSVRFLNQLGDYTVNLTQVKSIFVGSGSVYVRPLDGSDGVCFNRSAWDLEKDYYPNGSRVANNIGYAKLYSDTTCNGKTLSYVYESGTSGGGSETGGQNPPTQPEVTPAPTPESNPQDPSQHVVVFLERYYVNVYYELEPGHWDIEDREYRSISVPNGWSYVLVDKDGKQQCFNFSHHNMQDYSEWHVRIASIAVFSSDVCMSNNEPEPEPLGDAFARFWNRKDYDGGSLAITWTGDENYYWNPTLRFEEYSYNDSFESVEVNDNRAVAVFEHDNLQGGVKCYNADDNDFSNDTFDNGLTVANNISSLRFFTRAQCSFQPNAPIELWVHEAKRGAITLTWVKSSPDTDVYNIKLYQNGAFQTVATLSDEQARVNAQNIGSDPKWIRAWTFTDVTCDQNYTFVVSASSERAESLNSRQVTALVECDCNDPAFEGVGLYDLRYCKGDSVQLTEPGWYNLADFNDAASSIFVKPGWSLEVFENTSNTDGLTTCVPENKWDLSYDNFWLQPTALDNAITRVRVWNAPNCGRTLPMTGCDAVNSTNVTLFDHTHCLGLDKSLVGTGFHLLDDFDDLTSSVYVPPGKSARLYENANKEGNYVCVRDTKWDMLKDYYWWDLITNTFNNVSAVEVFDDDLCGGVPAPTITFPAEDSHILDTDYVVFEWENVYAGGYWLDLWGPNGFHQSSGHLNRNLWNFGELEPGEYTLIIQAEAYGVIDGQTKKTFVVHPSAPAPELSVSYSQDPDQTNLVTFHVVNCSGASVHYVFGHDGMEADAACTDGGSSIVHEFPYAGETVSYNSVVAGINVQVNLYRLADCGEKAPVTGVSLFSEDDCRGERRNFATVGTFALSDFNDQTSAILVAPGWSVEVFENFNSSDGHAFCATQDIWKAGFENYYATQNAKMGDSISNIRVYNDSTCGKELPQYGGCGANIVYDGVVLFDYIHCGGSEQAFNQPGKYELGYGGEFNDLASSIHIPAGWSVMLYDTSSWSGNKRCVAGDDMWDLGIDKYWDSESIINNTISSVEVFTNTTCQPTEPELPALGVPQNLYPSGGIFTTGKSVTLRWNGVQGADLYKLEITGGNVQVLSTTNAYIVFTPQQSGSYSWKVKAVRDNQESGWSSTALFTASSPVTATPTPLVTETSPVTPVPSITPTPITPVPTVQTPVVTVTPVHTPLTPVPTVQTPVVTVTPVHTPLTPVPTATPVPSATTKPTKVPATPVVPDNFSNHLYMPNIQR